MFKTLLIDSYGEHEAGEYIQTIAYIHEEFDPIKPKLPKKNPILHVKTPSILEMRVPKMQINPNLKKNTQ